MMTIVATPPTVTSLLQSRQEVAHGTMAFRFDKPLGWAFTAGQFLDMTLLNPAENRRRRQHPQFFDRQRAG
jgi:ferredoxin-NADP reductase